MKLNKTTEYVLREAAGQDTIELVDYIKDKKNISEFKVAEAMKKNINDIRNMLYRLLNNNLVTFTRKKDKKKGWYIYYWTYNPKMIKHLYFKLKKKRLDGLNDRLKRENIGNFFICPNKCIRFDFEQATDFEYKCPECGSLMGNDENAGKIKDIQKEIKDLEKEIKTIKA